MCVSVVAGQRGSVSLVRPTRRRRDPDDTGRMPGQAEDGLVRATGEGTPQGGPLSPLLSNLVLDELDRELERRGHRFVRYADDSNIYVRSERAGQRVMASVSAFITKRLRLKVNETKSAVARPWDRKFLGFSFTADTDPKRRLAPVTVRRLRQRVRELTRTGRHLAGGGVGKRRDAVSDHHGRRPVYLFHRECQEHHCPRFQLA